MINPFETIKEKIETSPIISDEIKKTTCYMCACRCGINVHFKDGDIRYIEGNKDHPTNKGVLCAKGSAGIMQQNSPAKLKKPLMRIGDRGSGEFKEIEWEEALKIATTWLSEIRNSDPKKTSFFYWKRSKSIINRLVGKSIWYSKFCSSRRFLLS